MQKRIEHFPYATLHAICEKAQAGQETTIQCQSFRAAMKIANQFWEYRKLRRAEVAEARLAGRIVSMPFGLEETACVVDKQKFTATFCSRETRPINKILAAALEHGSVTVTDEGAVPTSRTNSPGSSATNGPDSAPVDTLALYGVGGPNG